MHPEKKTGGTEYVCMSIENVALLSVNPIGSYS